jgi:hypothetical protein
MGHEEPRRAYAAAAADLIAKLRNAGFEIETVGDLVQQGIEYKEAVPLLVTGLKKATYDALQEDIVRTLSVPWARPALPALIEEFERSEPERARLRWTISNAIEVLADDSTFDWLSKILPRRAYGRDRQMLVLALRKVGHREAAIRLLLGLLDDDTVNGHALTTLNRLKAAVSKVAIQRFEDDKRAWVRREARRLLGRAV